MEGILELNAQGQGEANKMKGGTGPPEKRQPYLCRCGGATWHNAFKALQVAPFFSTGTDKGQRHGAGAGIEGPH